MRSSTRFCFLSLLLLAAVAEAGISVEYASQADFSAYRTFTFTEADAAADPQVQKWLEDAITREMREKGLQRLAQGGDLLVRAELKVRQEQRLEVDILGQGSILEKDTTKVTPGEYARDVGMGMLVVELLDGYSKLTVWQGVVGAVTRPEVGKSSQKRLDKVIGRLFKKYPPK